MKRMHLHINAQSLESSIAFYTALFGTAPKRIDAGSAEWSIDSPRLDLTVTAGAQPGLDHVAIHGETAEDMTAIYRRLGAANLATNPGTADAAMRGDSNAAIDPTGLIWKGLTLNGTAAAGAGHITPQSTSRAEPALMTGQPITVLFLCTGNSARSIMAEAILRRMGGDRFIALSAGSMPRGSVHPRALAVLEQMQLPIAGLRSKSWDEFTGPDAPEIDFVFTLCDTAAMEVCPIWPSQPMTAHWGLPDPAAVNDSEAIMALAFADTFRMLERRIGIFVNLPLAELTRLALQRRIQNIGRESWNSPRTDAVAGTVPATGIAVGA